MASLSKIHFHKKSNLLNLHWADGQVQQLSGELLRQYCPCSKCRAKNVVGSQLITDNGQITNLTMMGTTGLQMVFADGHDRGIYPWDYLKAINEGNALRYIEG